MQLGSFGVWDFVSSTNSTDVKRTGVSSWKHLIDVHLNFIIEI